MPAETTAKREAGVDLARAFALLLLVMVCVGRAVQLQALEAQSFAAQAAEKMKNIPFSAMKSAQKIGRIIAASSVTEPLCRP